MSLDAPILRVPERPTGAYEARSRMGRRLLATTAVCTLVAAGCVLVFTIWPTPLTVACCLSLGNGAFGVGLACYAVVVALDLKRRRAL